MFAALLLIALAPVAYSAATCGMICIELYDPVCGSDGTTYSNTCYLDSAKCRDHTLTLAHQGECGSGHQSVCPQLACLANYDPVCGTDGKTYSNTCELKTTHCHGDVTVAYSGPCAV